MESFRRFFEWSRREGKRLILSPIAEVLESLPALWEAATFSEQHELLITTMDALFVDTVEEKSIVAIRPKPAFRPLFEIATNRAGSGVVLINQTP